MSKVLDRDRPYRFEHERSKAKRMAPPKDLLGWFVRGFRDEVPDAIHSRGVWRDYKPLSDDSDRQPVGGSLLGSPRHDDTFRRFIEDPALYALEVAEYDGHKDTVAHYKFPMRAAIAALNGRGKDTDPYPFMARTLYRTAAMDGDWDAACRSMGITEPVRRVYIETALHRLWERYETEPPSRLLRIASAA